MKKEGGHRVSNPGVRIGGVTTSRPSYVLWRSPDLLLRVEFPASVLEEIRAESLRTAHALRGSGIEFGGVLLGTRLGDLVRVLAWAPIECQHAFGPAFVLSAQDEELLAAQLDELRRRSTRTGLLPVGWFSTNLQGQPEPPESHLRIHATHFSQSGGVLLLCQPDLSGIVRLNVTGNREDGTGLRTYANPLVLEPAAFRSRQAQQSGDANARYRRTTRWTRARSSPPSLVQPDPVPREKPAAHPLSWRARAWAATAFLAVTVVLLLAAGALWLQNQGLSPTRWIADQTGLHRWTTVSTLGPRSSPLQLPSVHAFYSRGKLTLAWDAAGMRRMNAIVASVEIRNRSRVARYRLPASRLASGQWTMRVGMRPSSARLRYQTAAGTSGEESIRFLSAPAARR